MNEKKPFRPADIVIKELSEEALPQILQLQNERNLSPWSDKDYLQEISKQDSCLLIAASKNEILGFIVMRRTVPTDAEIYNLAVKKEFEGRSIGTRLLTEAIRLLADSKEDSGYIWLEVRESNKRAIAFYEKHGFIITGRRKNFYSNPQEDALLMRLEIKSEIVPSDKLELD